MPRVPVPTVEVRLRAISSALDALRTVANLVDEPAWVPLPQCANEGESHRSFSKWTAQIAIALTEQVAAVQAAIVAECGELEAPLVGGAQ